MSRPPRNVAADWDSILARAELINGGEPATVAMIKTDPRINAVDLIVAFLGGLALGALAACWAIWWLG